MEAGAVAVAFVAKEEQEELPLEGAALVAHLHAAAQNHVPGLVDEEGEIAQGRPVAYQHVEVRVAAGQQERNVAGVHAVGREAPGGDPQGLVLEEPPPVEERQHREYGREHGHHHRQDAVAKVAAEVALGHGEGHGEGLVILERRGGHAGDHAAAGGHGHKILDDLFIIAAFKAGRALKGLREGHREGERRDGVLLGGEQGQGEDLAGLPGHHQIGEGIGDLEGLHAGKAAVAFHGEYLQAILIGGAGLVALDFGALGVLGEAHGDLLEGADDVQRQRALDVGTAAVVHRHLELHRLVGRLGQDGVVRRAGLTGGGVVRWIAGGLVAGGCIAGGIAAGGVGGCCGVAPFVLRGGQGGGEQHGRT